MKIQAKVNRVAFSKESGNNLWMILLTEKGTFKGSMPAEPTIDDNYEFNGEWTVFNGQKEFKFIGSMPVIPNDPKALLSFVCTRALGVGEKLKEAIWEKWGASWQEQFDTKSKDVKSLTDKRVIAIQEALDEAKVNEVQVKVLSYLMSHECSETIAYKAWNQWKQDTISKVKDDCFILTSLSHIGFTNIDGKISTAFGIAFTDARRIKAGIAYGYKQVTSSGATAVLAGDLVQACSQLLRIPTEKVSEVLQLMLDLKKMKLFTVGYKHYFSSWDEYVHELTIKEMIDGEVKKGKFW